MEGLAGELQGDLAVVLLQAGNLEVLRNGVLAGVLRDGDVVGKELPIELEDYQLQ